MTINYDATALVSLTLYSESPSTLCQANYERTVHTATLNAKKLHAWLLPRASSLPRASLFSTIQSQVTHAL